VYRIRKLPGRIKRTSMYKLVAYDLDGTLINKEQVIPDSAFEAMRILDESGVINVLTTGRSWYVVPKVLKGCGYLRHAVFSSGARIADLGKQEMSFRGVMNNSEAEKLISLAHEFNGSVLAFFKNGVVYENGVVNQSRKKIVQSRRNEGISSIYVLDDALNALSFLDGLEKITIEYDKTYVDEIQNRIKRIEDYEMISSFSFLSEAGKNGEKLAVTEINRKGITKGSGLIEICRNLNIDLKETIAIGDSENDLPMMKTAGFSIAMGNSSLTTKENADFVTKDIMDDGVLFAVEKLFGLK